MKWKGETKAQQDARLQEWHKHFCLFPRQMRNGTWVWLAHCWCIMRRTLGGSFYFEFSDSVTRPEDVRPTRPVPPDE